MPRDNPPAMTDERRAAIVEALRAGEQVNVIGARLRISRQRIRYHGRRAGLPPLNRWQRGSAAS